MPGLSLFLGDSFFFLLRISKADAFSPSYFITFNDSASTGERGEREREREREKISLFLACEIRAKVLMAETVNDASEMESVGPISFFFSEDLWSPIKQKSDVEHLKERGEMKKKKRWWCQQEMSFWNAQSFCLKKNSTQWQYVEKHWKKKHKQQRGCVLHVLYYMPIWF